MSVPHWAACVNAWCSFPRAGSGSSRNSAVGKPFSPPLNTVTTNLTQAVTCHGGKVPGLRELQKHYRNWFLTMTIQCIWTWRWGFGRRRDREQGSHYWGLELQFFLLLFKYSCLHFPHHHFLNHPHLPPSVLPSFGFVHESFIHVPWWPFLPLLPLLSPPPPPSPLVTVSLLISMSAVIFCLFVCCVD